ncbi:hypothetical protein BUALT_Bualt18G0055200 [Buddleja alternifolia]|uniref:Uncharacterized protein n=1 Tax=Buddleja alternifolia TaxID=168488 RepID=A0AAV6WC77_9LAMI|nr:hypothetical protein BUALT_Bualt18G0055200 [Buddleja alternifolia]
MSSTEIFAQERTVLTCTSRRSRCFLKKIPCPRECPLTRPKDSKAKVCYVNCDSPICKAERKHRKPSCTGVGAACYDPRLIGADGVVFYFHGKINHHYTLVSDNNLQINARFIGHRPATRTRDYTWIQALGIRFGSHTLSVEVTKSSTWNNNIDHLKLSFDGNDVVLPQTALSAWESRNGDVKLERLESQNSVAVSVNGIVEIGVNVVPISKEEDRVHNYQLPSDDCFAHLEVQFRFLSLSAAVEGVLGRTYRRDYESRARLGVAMAVVGGEDEYRVASLFDVDCKKCVFSKTEDGDKVSILEKIDYGLMDCSHKLLSGNGIVCKK